MRLTRLQLTQFQGYAHLDLDLSEVDLLVIVGDNGAGKSALREAFTWACYGDSRASVADRLIRRGEDACSVRVTFLTDAGATVTVERVRPRGRSGSLTLTVDGEVRSGHTIADTQAAIISLIGLTGAGLAAGPFMDGAAAGSFMSAKPASRKDLIAELGGLDRYALLWQQANVEVATAKRDLESLGERRAQAQGVVDRIGVDDPVAGLARVRQSLAAVMENKALASDRVLAVAGPLAAAQARVARHALLEADIQRWDNRLTSAVSEQSRLEGLLTTLRSDARERPGPAAFPPDPEALRAAYIEAQDRAQAAEFSAASLSTFTQRAADARRSLDAAEAIVNRAGDAPCGGLNGPYAASCVYLASGATVDIPALRGALAEAREQIAHSEQMALGVPVLRGRADAAEASLRAAERAFARAEADADALAARLAAAAQREAETLEALRARGDEVAALRGDMERAQAELHSIEADFTTIRALENEDRDARAVLESCNAQLPHLESTVQYAQGLVDQYRSNLDLIAELTPQIVTREADLACWTILARAFHRDGIPSVLLASMLPLIESRANEVLGRLPGNFSLHFSLSRELASGGTSDDLDVIVDVEGEPLDYEMLSTGQRLRVDIALRLGLASMLAARHGSSIHTLWLDEPLAPLSQAGKAAFVDMLTALSGDFGLVIVVSHDPDFNDRFGSVLEVSMETGISTARLIA